MVMGKQEKKSREKEESRGSLTAREPFGELGDWWPFGRGRSSHLQRMLRELDEEWPGSFMRGGWLPALDIHETDGEYAVTVELAGARKEDVTVECHDGILTIRGEKKSEREEEKEKRRFVERRYGTFSRSFSLPSDADSEKIDAKFENGVLTLTIPKSEAAKPRTVAVK
jgi:HSP20 family protein